MKIYLILFFTKLIENAISTLRIIVISHDKKLIGAMLNFIIAVIWAVSTGIIVNNFSNPLNILFFALGCFFGSYLGSILEKNLNHHLNK